MFDKLKSSTVEFSWIHFPSYLSINIDFSLYKWWNEDKLRIAILATGQFAYYIVDAEVLSACHQ